MTHRPWPLLKRVTSLLRDGFQPWWRLRSPGPGSVEVWARYDRDTGEVEEVGPVTPAEGELVSNIMQNRYRGNYKRDTRSIP